MFLATIGWTQQLYEHVHLYMKAASHLRSPLSLAELDILHANNYD